MLRYTVLTDIWETVKWLHKLVNTFTIEKKPQKTFDVAITPYPLPLTPLQFKAWLHDGAGSASC